jgi:hypothetical protein
MAEGVADALTAGTVKLPGVGPVKKVYVYVGVGAVGVLAAYIIWKRQQAASDVPYEDAALGDGLTTDPGSDVYQGANAGGQGSGGDDVPTSPRTNPEWTTAALEYFNWMEPGYVTSVLGKYLSRVSLSLEEADFVRQVWAAIGKPPEGPSNFTLTSDTNTPGSGTELAAPTDLTAGPVTSTTISLNWDDVTGSTGYQLFRNGAQVATASGSYATDTGLAPNTSYSYSVKAVNGSKTSASSATVTGKTAAATSTNPPATPGKPIPADSYFYVTVAKFDEKHPVWNSTISGIAAKYGYGETELWNLPKNIGLRSSRKQPKLIRPGDKVWIKRR